MGSGKGIEYPNSPWAIITVLLIISFWSFSPLSRNEIRRHQTWNQGRHREPVLWRLLSLLPDQPGVWQSHLVPHLFTRHKQFHGVGRRRVPVRIPGLLHRWDTGFFYFLRDLLVIGLLWVCTCWATNHKGCCCVMSVTIQVKIDLINIMVAPLFYNALYGINYSRSWYLFRSSRDQLCYCQDCKYCRPPFHFQLFLLQLSTNQWWLHPTFARICSSKSGNVDYDLSIYVP